MPRNGAGVASAVPGSNTVAANTTILSALHNSLVNDLINMFNTAWPVSLGGTGGTTPITSWDAITAKGSDVASASTLVLTTATGPRIDITGTTTVTAVTLAAGTWRLARATGIFQITASASLLVNGSATVNYTTQVGDTLLFQADASVISITIINSGFTKGPAVASATTTVLLPNRTQHITGTTTITDVDFAPANDGGLAWVIFDGALILTHNGTTLILPGAANITTAAGDRALFMQDSGDNVYCLSYIPASPVINTLNGQYKFPSTQNPSSDGFTFDDYREVSWTPAMTFGGSATGITYATQQGTYIKLGSLVYLWGHLVLTNNGSGVGTALITGVPFTALTNAVGSGLLTTGGSAATGIKPFISAANTMFLLIPGAAADAFATDTNCTNTFDFYFSIAFQVT